MNNEEFAQKNTCCLKKVLVTGASGFIGSFLVEGGLEREMQVWAGVRKSSSRTYLKDSRIQFAELDFAHPGRLTEQLAVHKQLHGGWDYIIHCASVTASKMMVSQPVETLITSIEGTKNLLDLAAEKKVQSFVYVSSMEMYGTFEKADHEITEKDLGYIDPLKIRSNYPESKRLCENICIAYMAEYNVPVKIARLAQTFGAGILPGENRVFAQFARSAMNGEDIVLHTKGLSEGNYCYTRDAVLGLFTILLEGENGEAYNVANPDSHTTIADMAQMVCEKIGDGKMKVVFDIPESNTYGYAADTKMKLNSDKLQLLGWKPEIGLEEAYRRLIECMKE